MTEYPESELARFMQVALATGRRALPACRPNPPVGCVLVRAGQIVARGYTNPPGQAHAEAMALAQIEGDLRDVTAFVTLEPCSFHGRTPSCAGTLVQRRIGRLYAALLDPHPKNQGRGIEILEEGGIPVALGLLAEEAQRDLGPYLLGD